jgi:mono/diheme cytochrome c family protein
MSGPERTKRQYTHGALRPVTLLIGLVVLASALSGCGGGSSDPPRVGPDASPEAVLGQELVDQSCTACHGKDYTGVSGLGTSFVDNAYIRDHADAEVVAFIKEGRLSDAPENVTGVAMPPYGGNPRLTDDDLAAIVAFLRTLQ